MRSAEDLHHGYSIFCGEQCSTFEHSYALMHGARRHRISAGSGPGRWPACTALAIAIRSGFITTGSMLSVLSVELYDADHRGDVPVPGSRLEYTKVLLTWASAIPVIGGPCPSDLPTLRRAVKNMLVLDRGRCFDLDHAPRITIREQCIHAYQHTIMLKCCFKNRVLRPFADEPRRLPDRMAHATRIRDYYGIFVAVNPVGRYRRPRYRY